jgi:hypothetical protein
VGQLGTRVLSRQMVTQVASINSRWLSARINEQEPNEQEPNVRRLVDTKALGKCKAVAPFVARSAGTPSMARRLLVQRGVGVGVGNQRRINNHV